MLLFYCKRSNKSREAYLSECIIKSENTDKVDIICEIAGVKKELFDREIIE